MQELRPFMSNEQANRSRSKVSDMARMPRAGSVSKNKMRKLHKQLRQELIAETRAKHRSREAPLKPKKT